MDEREQLIERIERAEDRYLEIWSTNLTSPLQSVDLTMQQLKTLMLLSFRDGLSGHELSEALGVGLAAVTGMANRLTDRGLVRRAEDPNDRRVRRVYLTEQGTELIDMLMVMVGWADKWLAGKAGPPVLYRHRACGEISHVDLRCAHCGEPMHAGDVELLPGPGAAVPAGKAR